MKLLKRPLQIFVIMSALSTLSLSEAIAEIIVFECRFADSF